MALNLTFTGADAVNYGYLINDGEPSLIWLAHMADYGSVIDEDEEVSLDMVGMSKCPYRTFQNNKIWK